jgi:hypothetical protein
MVLTLRVKRGLARLVLRHLVGRVLLALLAEVLLSLGDVHLWSCGGEGPVSGARTVMETQSPSDGEKDVPTE